jgi:hypothetical protein
MKKETIIKISVLILVIATILVNALANILPINGLTTGKISDSISILFVPSGYVFSIWGLIYLGLLFYAFYIFKDFQKEDREIFPWFVLSSISNITWILLWHHELVALSVVAMILLLTSLIAIYMITEDKKYSKIKRVPFQIYLGWVSVATIANIAGALYIANWNGFGIPKEIWAVVMIGVATKLAILITSLKKDIYYPLVIIWAIVGILLKFFSTSDMITGATLISIMAILMNIFSNTYCRESTPVKKK